MRSRFCAYSGRLLSDGFFVVPSAGLEPALPFEKRILSGKIGSNALVR